MLHVDFSNIYIVNMLFELASCLKSVHCNLDLDWFDWT